jgi:hypothetical protein
VATLPISGATQQPAPINLLPSLLGLYGIALVASVLPLLPAALVGLFTRSCARIRLYGLLLGTISVFTWLFITWFQWKSLRILSGPQPIAQRYFMMLVPIFIPLAFVGLERMIESLGRLVRWRTLIITAIVSMALAVTAQAALYDRTIWSNPLLMTVNWEGGCDILYGALGFPVIVVTTAMIGALVAIRLASPRSAPIETFFRTSLIVIFSAGLAGFNVATGMAGARFAWNGPFLEISAAHGQAIATIIGDKARDPRAAFVNIEPAVINSIEASAGVRIIDGYLLFENLSFWSGRPVMVNGVIAFGGIQDSAKLPHYSVSLVTPGTVITGAVYRVGDESFQVKTVPAQ